MKDFIENDNDGNELICKNGEFYLGLSKEGGRHRKIGYLKVTKKGVPWYIKDHLKEGEHLFGTRSHRYPLSWGLHEALLRKLPEGTMVGLRSDVKKYAIPVKVALDTKFFRYFKNQGFELQVFVPLDKWRHIDD